MTDRTVGGSSFAVPAAPAPNPDAVRRRGIAFLAAALCLNFQFFFSVGHNFETHPLAPPLLLEAVLASLIVWAVVYMARAMVLDRVDWLDILFFVTPPLFVLTSAILAWTIHGQPIVMGIGEDRRGFAFYFWFLLRPIARRHRLDADAVLWALAICAGVYITAGFVARYAFTEVMRARLIPDFDPRKLRISSPGEGFAFCAVAGLVLLLNRSRLLGAAMMGAGWTGMLVIAQTRQVILALLAGSCFAVLVNRPVRAVFVYFPMALALLVAAALSGGPLGEVIQAALPNIEEFDSENLEFNTRYRTFSIVWEGITGSGFTGSGALSLRFHTGLQMWYGRNFFINDVGIFGEIYRVGVVAIVLYLLWWLTHLRLLARLPTRRDRELMASLLVTVLFLFTAGWIFRYGYVHAFVALFAVCALGHGGVDDDGRRET